MRTLNRAVLCMDASLHLGGMSENTNIAERVDELLTNFRNKYEISAHENASNSDAWEAHHENMSSDWDEIEEQILLIVWDSIKNIMINCGAGDAVSDVLELELAK